MERHIVLRTDWCNSMEHGMLRDFEDVISETVGASIIEHPSRKLSAAINKRISPGTRFEGLRNFLFRKDLDFNCDVLWVPLMGPEDFQLDLYKNWDVKPRFKILYLFDTFPRQYSLIKKITERFKFDLLLTSFHGAVADLTKICKREWHCIPQGVRLDRFYPRGHDQGAFPPIHLTSYGRREPEFHRELLAFCRINNFWYDYTAVIDRKLAVPAQDYYQIYADHIGSSLMNVSWCVEQTHAERSGGLSAITCRWFEAAASACVIIGRAPSCQTFENLFGKDSVHTVPNKKNHIKDWLDEMFKNKNQLRQRALLLREQLRERWSWKSRVNDILKYVGQV